MVWGLRSKSSDIERMVEELSQEMIHDREYPGETDGNGADWNFQD